jgi:hypothetical protein
MSTPSEGFRRIPGKRALQAVALLLVLVATAAPAASAPQSIANPPASAAEREELRQAIESRYEVLPVSGGIVLKPRRPRAGVRTIEVTGREVAVNGERVSARTLRDWLGEDAEPVLRLQGLSAAEQRRVFALDEAAAEPGPAPSAEEAEQEEQEVTEVTETPAEPDESAEPEETAEPAEPAEPEEPSRYSTGDQVNVGGSVTIRKGEVVSEAVAVGGGVTVEEGAEVLSNATAVGGSARIDGKVGGEVVSVGSSVHLGPRAVVEGAVTSVGGRIHRAPGSAINGPTTEVAWPFFGGDWGDWDWDWNGWGLWPSWIGVSEVLSSLMGLVLMGLLTCLVLMVARRPLERVDRQLVSQPWPSAFAGLMGVLFFWPLFIVVTVLLAITIIGCALFLLYPFLFLYLGLLFLLGYATVAYRLGRWIEIRFNRNFGGPYAVALVGVFLIQIWSVLGELLDLVPGPFSFFAFMVGMFGFLVKAAAWIVGFGAVILARFGLEPGYWPRRGAPVPPPSYTPPPGYTPPPSDQLPLSEPRWEDERPPYPQTPEEGEPPR